MAVCLRLDEPITKRTSSVFDMCDDVSQVIQFPYAVCEAFSPTPSPKDMVLNVLRDLQDKMKQAYRDSHQWVQSASLQLIDIHCQNFIDDLTNEEEDLVIPSTETMNIARTLVMSIYREVKELPVPRIDTDYETGDVSIVFRGADSRMDLVVLNSINQIQCLYSDSDTTKDISDFAEVITSLKKLAA